MTDLGYANGWTETPEIVKKCRENEHVTKKKIIGNCVTQYYCHLCLYTYKIDSGD